MATGAPGTNGVWQYGEDDSEATFSALLNKAASTTDTQLGLDRARLTTLEARKLSGLSPVIPSSVSVGSGSGSFNSTTGLVTFTGASSLSLNGIFSSNYAHYRIIFEVPTATATTAFNTRFRTGGTDNTVAYYAQYWVMSRIGGTVQSNNGGSATSAGFGTTIALTNRLVQMTADVVNPFATKTTELTGIGTFYDATGSYMNTFSVLYDNAVSFDGMTIFLSTGNMTGTMRVLGYN